jgi:hypothetical protein
MSRCPLHTVVAVLLIGLAAAASRGAPEPGVAVTVYNNNFAVVKDIRPLDIAGPNATLRFADVAKQIDPTSVHFKSLTDPAGTTVLEQNYEYDLVSANKLLDKYIDRPLAVITDDGAKYEGTLLSFDQAQIVLQGREQLFMIQRPDNVRNIEFGKLPEGLLTRPTLVWRIATDKPGRHTAEVTYQTTGINWKADYTALINDDDTLIDLGGWVTINNQSGGAYTNARVKLIAGDVRRIQPARPRVQMLRERAGAPMADDAGGFQEKSFFEYHLYTLDRKTTIKENQIKQIELLSADRVPVTKRYVFEPGGRFWHRRYGDKNEFKVNVFLELTNDKASNLGMPLPRGKVRVYKRDREDTEFVGEDLIDHTPRDEQLKLYVGDAFDLVGEYDILDRRSGKRWRQEDVRIKLRNHKEDANVTIRVRIHLNGPNWDIRDPSHEFVKIDASTIEFDIPVKVDSQTELTYTAGYRW